jgi:phosphatidate cytidylyltransferase
MLRARVISAFVLGIPALLAVIAGGWWYALVVAVVLGVAAVEFTRLIARQGHRAYGGLLLLWVALSLANRVFPDAGLLEPGMAALLLCAIVWTLVRYAQGTVNAITGFAFTVMGGLLLGWGGAHFLGLRGLDGGVFWMLIVILSVWCTDTASYFVGSTIGRTRMLPAISPGKTWEGFAAGIVGGPLGAFIFMTLWRAVDAGFTVRVEHCLAIGLIASTIGPLGDLIISTLKRYVGVKDASHLIPGHGGMLDRVDTLITAGLASYYFLTLVVLSGG